MANYPGECANFYLEKNGQLFAFTRKQAARLTDPKDSNKFLPLSLIALQSGVEFVRDNLGLKDYGADYNRDRSNMYKRDFFFHILIKRVWFEDKYPSYYNWPFSKDVHFIYKNIVVMP